MTVNNLLRSRASLAKRLEQEVLTKKINAEEALQILICYMVREGTISEFSLPTATN